MIVQCKECQRVLKVDETKFSGDRIRGVCGNCKTVIDVEHPDVRPPSAPMDMTGSLPSENTVPPPVSTGSDQTLDMDMGSPASSVRHRGTGLTIGKKLLILFLAFIFITGGVITFLYMSYVPSLMYDQVSLRTYSLAQSFSGAVQDPLLTKNYLLVNQTAAANAKLPHVAYVSVLNNRGIVIAGIFGDTSMFDQAFRDGIKKNGFPREIAFRNRLAKGAERSVQEISAGGQKIHDVAVPIGDTGGEAHVGIFTADVEKEVQKSLIPLLLALAVMILIGSFSFYMVAKSISMPIRSLTRAAEKISIGEMDHPIEVKGGGEIIELADSLERMRFSINTAMARLMNQ